MTSWHGSIPRCALCGANGLEEFIDGKTIAGPWAVMCPECFRSWGLGLGVGRGQRYRWNGEGWEERRDGRARLELVGRE